MVFLWPSQQCESVLWWGGEGGGSYCEMSGLKSFFPSLCPCERLQQRRIVGCSPGDFRTYYWQSFITLHYNLRKTDCTSLHSPFHFLLVNTWMSLGLIQAKNTAGRGSRGANCWRKTRTTRWWQRHGRTSTTDKGLAGPLAYITYWRWRPILCKWGSKREYAYVYIYTYV